MLLLRRLYTRYRDMVLLEFRRIPQFLCVLCRFLLYTFFCAIFRKFLRRYCYPPFCAFSRNIPQIPAPLLLPSFCAFFRNIPQNSATLSVVYMR